MLNHGEHAYGKIGPSIPCLLVLIVSKLCGVVFVCRGKARWGRAQMLKQWGDHLVQLGTPSTLSEGSAAPGHGMRFSEYVRLMDWCVRHA